MRYQAVTMREVIKHVKSAVLYLPPSLRDYHNQACPWYHIKGLYNARCRQSNQPPYPSIGDQALMEWDQGAIPGRRGEGGGRELGFCSGPDHGSAGHMSGGEGKTRPPYDQRAYNQGGSR